MKKEATGAPGTMPEAGGEPCQRAPKNNCPSSRQKFPAIYFFGFHIRQYFAQATGIALVPGSDMWIISAIFQGIVITKYFGKVCGI
jgi:hypothetical protein